MPTYGRKYRRACALATKMCNITNIIYRQLKKNNPEEAKMFKERLLTFLNAPGSIAWKE